MVYRLAEVRKARGFTQEALARASKVNRANIAKYEIGTSSPTLQTAEKLAQALKVTVDELIGEQKAG